MTSIFFNLSLRKKVNVDLSQTSISGRGRESENWGWNEIKVFVRQKLRRGFGDFPDRSGSGGVKV